MDLNEEQIARFSSFLRANNLSETLQTFLNEVHTKSVLSSSSLANSDDSNKRIKIE